MVVVGMVACKEKETPKPPCDGSLSLAVSGMSNSSCGQTTGSLTVQALGGAGNYEYQLASGAYQAGNQFSNLAPGLYEIRVKDECDCTAQVEAQVLTGLTLTDIRPLLETYCSVATCHDGTDGLTDYRVDATVLSRTEVIKTRTASRNMPPSNSGLVMSQSEIDSLVCWVDDGAPE